MGALNTLSKISAALKRSPMVEISWQGLEALWLPCRAAAAGTNIHAQLILAM